MKWERYCDKIILSVSQLIIQLGVSMENAKKQALRRLHLALSIDAPSCDTDTRLWCLLFVIGLWYGRLGVDIASYYRVLDLFSGAGGFSVGLDMLDEFETVVATDFYEPALNTLKKNLVDVDVVLGDITNPDTKKAIVECSRRRNVNMVVGGPPCQGFSNKGKKLGLKDPRNFLFREYLDIVKTLMPEVFVIENVKAMSSSVGGYFLKEIIRSIHDLGYYCDNGILTASDFGVPQDRQRTIIIACNTHKIRLPGQSQYVKVKTTVRDAISDLDYLESGEGEFCQDYITEAVTEYQRWARRNSHKLYNHVATKHSEVAIDKLKMIPPEGDKSSLPAELRGNQQFKTTWGRLTWDGQSPTIDTRFDTPSNGTNSHPVLNRAITPREAARLQSFPDEFIFWGKKTDICKQIGNAVPPLLARAIGAAILQSRKGVDLYNDDAYKVLPKLAESGLLVDHIITDPPYNISKDNNFQTMKSAHRRGVDFGEWDKNFDFLSWIDVASKMLKPGGSFIVFCSYRYISMIIERLEQNKLIAKDVIKWIKTNPMPRNITRRYVQDTEYAVWAIKPGRRWIFNKPDDVSYLRAEFRTPVVSGAERTSHPTQKSLSLMKRIVEVHTNEGQVIMDPFMGSGTTGVAALELGRNFIGIEIDKTFFSVAGSRIKEAGNEC